MLITTLRTVKEPKTHLIVYAAPVTKTMLQFNSLNYYSLPSLPRNWKAPLWLTVELGLFSGRLYFGFDEYSTVLKYLGQKFLDENKGKGYSATDIQERPSREQETPKYFANEPLNFFQDWLSIRRKGQDISYTPMGYVCQGRLLTREHPFFAFPEMVGLPENTDKPLVDKMRRMETTDLNSERARKLVSKTAEARRNVKGGNDTAPYSDSSSGESEDDYNYDEDEDAGDGEFDEQGDRSSEDGSSESSL